jgi:hypothetical protein
MKAGRSPGRSDSKEQMLEVRKKFLSSTPFEKRVNQRKHQDSGN